MATTENSKDVPIPPHSDEAAAVGGGGMCPPEIPESVSEITIGMLYPNLSPAELAEADAVIERYLEATLRQYERICSDPEAYAKFRRLLDEGKNDSVKGTPSVESINSL